MARRRMIDPNIWLSEDVSKLSIFERLMFIGMFSNADDEGRGRATPALLRSLIFPYDDIPLKEIEQALDNIVKKINIIIYEVDGSRYYEFTSWEKWQRVDRPQPSLIPGREENMDNNDSSNESENDSSNGSKNESDKMQESIHADSLLKEKNIREDNIREDKNIKEYKTNRRIIPALSFDNVPSEILDDIKRFADFRVKIRSPMTQEALRLLLLKLKDYTIDEQKKAINESILSGYKGVFPKKINDDVGRQATSFIDLAEEIEKE